MCPILVWDTSCRDRLSSLTWAHWEDWRRRVKVGASLRWVPAYLPEEVLLPSAHSCEPCVAGLYFRLYAAEPGFALEKDMVEGFLVCSVEVSRRLLFCFFDFFFRLTAKKGYKAGTVLVRVLIYAGPG